PQQASACFILAVDDTMDSILNWYVEEGTIFKGGSGSGINLSKIRSSAELLKGGGTASGPVSFMRGADASAGTIKSGGKTRRAATTGEIIKTVKARELMREISMATWECADPGMQFDTTINRWHTAHNTGRINGSNPCSEYMHLDNSACNLASINLLKFLGPNDQFDVDGFKAAVEVVFTA